MTSWRVQVAVLTLLLAGCAQLAGLRGRAVASCPAELVPTLEIAGDFLWRERVRVTVGDQVIAFQQVVQKRGDELLLVGLHPLGAKLFSVVQRGIETEIQAAPPPVLEVPPENLLSDLHRVRFRAVEGAGPDGTFRAVGSAEEIVEEWESGELRERVFRTLDAVDGAAVRVRYPSTGDGLPRVFVDNAACGYRAEIVELVSSAGD